MGQTVDIKSIARQAERLRISAQARQANEQLEKLLAVMPLLYNFYGKSLAFLMKLRDLAKYKSFLFKEDVEGTLV